MATQLQLRRGTTEQNSNFVGAQGEITMDTDTNALRVHNGTTAGGAAIIDTIVAFQRPSEDNGYTWYRKYSSGWVEQGGRYTNTQNISTTMPVEMSDTNYSVVLTYETDSSSTAQYSSVSIATSKTTTSFTIRNVGSIFGGWQVSGMAA